MILDRKLFKRLLDLIFCGVPLDTHHVVVVVFRICLLLLLLLLSLTTTTAEVLASLATSHVELEMLSVHSNSIPLPKTVIADEVGQFNNGKGCKEQNLGQSVSLVRERNSSAFLRPR